MYFSLRYIFVCQCLHHFITSYFCKNDDLRQRFVKMRRLSQTWKQKRTSERSSNHVIKQRIPNVHQINDVKDYRRNSSKVRYIQEIHPLRYKTVIELAKLSIKVNLSRVTAFFLDLGFGVIIYIHDAQPHPIIVYCYCTRTSILSFRCMLLELKTLLKNWLALDDT